MSTPYLYTSNNPNARIRDNGKRGWYYPNRRGGLGSIQVIVLHTTENSPSKRSAELTAKWQRDSAPSPSSYHKIVDSNSVLLTLPDGATSFSVVGYNTVSLNLSFATYARVWGKYPEWEAGALKLAAESVAEWCVTYDIPVRYVTKDDVDRGKKGITFHSRLDPARRSDPGYKFPSTGFLKLVQSFINKEDTLAVSEEDIRKIVRDELRKILPVNTESELDRLRLGVRELLSHFGIKDNLGDKGP